ncbi:MAG: UDP-3-O-(3-hydroxymyristoyl)glucosamine N-acyltransferase [Pirellulaceae bacterium]|nr:UDP-3-O-(3-hydroxymyristoyl)glucosamine N-acyltransferase [Pirellulaceae bacterium]
MQISLEELANKVSGECRGDGRQVVSNALPLHDASEGHLTLLESVKHIPRFIASKAVAAIVPLQDIDTIFEQTGKPVIGVHDLHAAFIDAIRSLRTISTPKQQGIDPRAIVDPSATIGMDVYVGPNATIGRGCEIASGCRIHAGVHIMEQCRIDEDCEIFPGSVLYPGTILGQRVVLHACAVLGAYGFGYRLRNGQHERTAQLGWVEIENDVEIGANTTVDRGTYGPTRIGEGTKLDNQIQIGHNAHIGRHNLLCAHVGIAGSASTGDYVVLAGQVGVRDHIHVGDRVSAAAQSGILKSLDADAKVMGAPALPFREATQIWIATQRLPEMIKEFRKLAASVAAIQATMPESKLPHSKAA